MRFIADAMLGRLARWLRLLGFDTLYCPEIADSEIIRLARREERLILTRDNHFRRKGLEACLFIDSGEVMEQVCQVIRDLRLRLPEEGRCANCNGRLMEVENREDVRDALADYVYMSFNRFRRCGGCGNVYWEGSQYRRLMERVEEIRRQCGA